MVAPTLKGWEMSEDDGEWTNEQVAQRRFWGGKRRELEVARHLGELMKEGGVFVNTVVEP